jgi:ABC-type lipoprotein release transport system permease subunit
MKAATLIWREAGFRRWSFALGVLGVALTVAVGVAFRMTAEASRRETVRLTRDLGFNLRIIAKQTDMDRFWMQGYSDATLPEASLARLASYERVFTAYNHLVGMLQRRVNVAGREVLLTGLAPAITAPEQKGRPMGFAPKPGTAVVGYRVAERMALKAGGNLRLGDKDYRVERCLAESGTEEDIRVYVALADAQRLLGLEGRIGEIQAIDCLCLTADQEPLRLLREELARAVPEATVIQLRTLADGRARQRQTSERYFRFVSPLLLAVCAAWVALLAGLNARERRPEIGVLRALGHGTVRIAGLFLGRAVLAGLVAGPVGWATGTALALKYGPGIFQVTAKSIAVDYALLGVATVAASVFAAVAAAVPVLHAVTLDPARTLREV